jgi:hypothetical protein
MDKMPSEKKKAIANTVPAILLFMTRDRAHKIRRIRDERINVVKERGRSKWPR